MRNKGREQNHTLRENRKHWNEGKLERKKKERGVTSRGWLDSESIKERKEGRKKERTYVIDENFYCLCYFFSIFRLFRLFSSSFGTMTD